MIRLYVATHAELMNSLKKEEDESSEEFREQRRRKRKSLEQTPHGPKGTTVRNNPENHYSEIFAPLRTAHMETDETTAEVVST
jgi:hypothetical protein